MLKSKMKKLISLCCAVALVATCSISAFAYTGACTVQSGSGLTVYIRAQFTASKTTNGRFETERGEHIKRCYVRLQEGSYDSGRVFSRSARSIHDNESYSAYTSRTNNPFATALTNYGWYYF